MATVKVEHVGRDCKWPEGEPIPQSLEQSLYLGWRVAGREGVESADELSETGMLHLQKDLGSRRLQISIPYKARFEFAKPGEAKARKLGFTECRVEVCKGVKYLLKNTRTLRGKEAADLEEHFITEPRLVPIESGAR